MSAPAREPGSAPFRVAAVEYLNARPLYEPLAGDPRVTLTLGLPREVARQVSEDEVDAALMPVAAAATIGDLRIARGMAIASRGPVRSVVIVSECPIDDVTELALDLSSRSSTGPAPRSRRRPERRVHTGLTAPVIERAGPALRSCPLDTCAKLLKMVPRPRAGPSSCPGTDCARPSSLPLS